MKSFFTKSRAFQTVPAVMFGAVCLLSSTLSAHAATPYQFALMQTQLAQASAQLDLLKAGNSRGEVLGASTTSATPVRPVCRLSVDKKSYNYGDSIKISWSTTGAADVSFVITPGQEGKDFQAYPQSPISKIGTATIKTSVLGLPTLTLKVTSVTGQTVYCTKYFAVVDTAAGTKDSKVAGLQAQILKLANVVRTLVEKRDALELQITNATAKSHEIQVAIDKILTPAGFGSGTSSVTGKPLFEYIGSEQTRVVSDINEEMNTGEFKMKFDVTAIDSDIYLPKTVNRMSFTDNKGIIYRVIDAATGRGTAQGDATASLTSTADSVGNYYKVAEGSSENFTAIVVYDPSARGTFQIELDQSYWSVTPTAPIKSTALPIPLTRDGGYKSSALFI